MQPHCFCSSPRCTRLSPPVFAISSLFLSIPRSSLDPKASSTMKLSRISFNQGGAQACDLCCHTDTVLRRNPCLVSRSVVTILKFLIYLFCFKKIYLFERHKERELPTLIHSPKGQVKVKSFFQIFQAWNWWHYLSLISQAIGSWDTNQRPCQTPGPQVSSLPGVPWHWSLISPEWPQIFSLHSVDFHTSAPPPSILI